MATERSNFIVLIANICIYLYFALSMHADRKGFAILLPAEEAPAVGKPNTEPAGWVGGSMAKEVEEMSSEHQENGKHV